jgi:hypothetical protein
MSSSWTKSQRAKVIALLAKGETPYKVSKHLKLNADTVRRFSLKYEEPEEIIIPEIIAGKSTLTDMRNGEKILEWVKTREDRGDQEAKIKAVIDELKKTIPRAAPVKAPPHVDSMLLNQFTVTDLHFGMLAWGDETGGDNYDLELAEKLLLDWFSAAIAMAPKAKVAVLAQLGDLMHHDSLEAVTPASQHKLDADSRLQKIIRVVIRVMRRVIQWLLQTHEKVYVIMASANHDPASSAWMREFLHALYENEPRIIVNNSPDVYYAYEHGKTSLFYHHGHKRTIKNVDHVFVAKFREMYGRSSHSYGHIGHLHNDQVEESNLMKIERHRTLAPQDAYAGHGGWVSKRDAKVITYHQEFGEVSRIILSPQMVSQ